MIDTGETYQVGEGIPWLAKINRQAMEQEAVPAPPGEHIPDAGKMVIEKLDCNDYSLGSTTRLENKVNQLVGAVNDLNRRMGVK